VIRILSLPSRHPYTSKFQKSGEIVFVNPETDYFNRIGGNPTPEFIQNRHQPDSYDLVHIHFSFDKLTVLELKSLLDYFKMIGKPIVWTCHSRESLREKGLGNGEFQKMLHLYSNVLITPTHGCKNWIINTYGNNKHIEVIPLGYMANPDAVLSSHMALNLKKKSNFIYLVGDMRQNKEINHSVERFLKCPQLSDCTLTIITKPLIENSINRDGRTARFFKAIHSSRRINLISQPEISNDYLTEIFCEQHVCMLPYLWGTHSGQVELAKDCGCYSVISNVGFYKEQDDEVISFDYDNDISIFTDNLIKSLIQAKSLPLLSPQPNNRKLEMNSIMKKHIDLYRKILEISNSEQKLLL